MSLLPASSIGDESIGFYNGIVEQSARFREPDDAYLYRVNSSDGNRKTMSFSWWYKRGQTSFGSYNIAEFFNHGGAGAGGTQSSARITLESNKFNLAHEDNNSTSWELISNALFRDHANFYHFFVAIDTTQSTASNRVRVYVNGTEITDWSTSTYPSQNADLRFGQAKHYIGVSEASGNPWAITYLDGYMCDVIYIDGTALTPSSFGEFKNGTWIAKAYTGSYGTNGHRLEFKNTTSGGASPSSSTIGADTSGNNNHYNDYNFSSHDSNLPDSPENNFATLNPLTPVNNGSLSEANLKYTSASSWGGSQSTFKIPPSGKWYVEFRIGSNTSNTAQLHFGVQKGGVSNGYTVTGYYGFEINNGFFTYVNGTYSGYTSGKSAGDILQMAIDADNGKIYYGHNNTYYVNYNTTGGDPSGGSNPSASSLDFGATEFVIIVRSDRNNGVINFGQDGSFAGGLTGGDIGTNSDANGIGAFKYAPPTDFLALCSSNLPDTELSPAKNEQANNHFDIAVHSSTGGASDSAGQAPTLNVTSLNFQPDWVIIKGRGYTDWGATFDSNRGVGKTLQAFRNYSEGDYANTLTAFNSDGFTLGADSTAQVNWRTNNYVSWNWHCNSGSTSTNDAGSIDGTQQVNTTAGYSITTYTANNNTKCTIGHGLDKAPNMIFVKNRSSSSNGQWTIGQDMYTGFTGQMYIDSGSNGTGGFGVNSGSFDNTAPTSTLVTLNTDNTVNEGTDSFVMYCFHSVEGYSKFGSYVGNNSTDGTFVYTGFRPAFVMVKYASGSGEDWIVWDKIRDPDNLVHNKLYWNTNNSEITDTTNRMMDFVSNGFKHRTDHVSTNGNGGTYIYMAFAEQPFKFSNAR